MRPWHLVLVIGAAVLAACVVVGLVVLSGSTHAPGRHLVWVAEKTTAASGVLPPELQHTAEDASADGGQLDVYAVGEQARHLDPVSLSVEQNGRPVQDDTARLQAIDQRLAAAQAAVGPTDVGTHGYNLFAALEAMADAKQGEAGALDVWFSSTVFTASDDPLRVQALTAADPGAAVDEVMKSSVSALNLHGTTVHPVLLAPVGAQQLPLGPADEQWRREFVTRLLRALGATVTEPVRSDTGTPPWAASSAVELIRPLPEPGPDAGETAPSTCANRRCTIDNLAFQGDSATLLDRTGTDREVAAFARAFPADATIIVTGYCARFGAAEGARLLAGQRADVIAALLQAHGIDAGRIHATGLGFDERADLSKPATDAAQRVVVITPSTS